jgi:PAS domain S-box-containing protein
MPEPTREILDWISDAAFVLDPGGRFLYINRRAAELAGRPASCLIGRTIREVFPEEWSPGFSACAEAALKEQDPSYFRGFCPPVSAWLDAVLYPGGRGLLAVLRDVTRQVLAEEQVHRALAEVEASRSELECLTTPRMNGNCKARDDKVAIVRRETPAAGPGRTVMASCAKTSSEWQPGGTAVACRAGSGSAPGGEST